MAKQGDEEQGGADTGGLRERLIAAFDDVHPRSSKADLEKLVSDRQLHTDWFADLVRTARRHSASDDDAREVAAESLRVFLNRCIEKSFLLGVKGEEPLAYSRQMATNGAIDRRRKDHRLDPLVEEGDGERAPTPTPEGEEASAISSAAGRQLLSRIRKTELHESDRVLLAFLVAEQLQGEDALRFVDLRPETSNLVRQTKHRKVTEAELARHLSDLEGKSVNRNAVATRKKRLRERLKLAIGHEDPAGGAPKKLPKRPISQKQKKT